MKHQWVNHSKNFVAPNTKSHTQTIEAIWSRLKKVFPENRVQQNLLMGASSGGRNSLLDGLVLASFLSTQRTSGTHTEPSKTL